MAFLYHTGIFCYGLIILVFSLFNKKARLFIEGRKNWKKNLTEKTGRNSSYIWFHCASLGEFEQGRPVMEEIKSKFPDCKILLTFFSPSGYEIRKNYSGADLITYLPPDTHANAVTFLDLTRPVKAFFVKYEFWYNYLDELHKRQVPTYVFSANFRKEQHFFQSYPWSRWFRKILRNFDHIFVQSQESAELLKLYGIEKVTVSGDTRFDRVIRIAENAKEIPVIEKFRDNSRLIIAGSTWKPDEELLIRFINENSGIKYIIAPHEVSDTNINRITGLLKKPWVRFSLINDQEAEHSDVILIDSIGLLSSLYKYGTIAYIGGGFGVGIHNILEAATFGLPVVFGPNYRKFREATELASLSGAFPITGFDELNTIFQRLLNNPDEKNAASAIALNYVTKNKGASSVILEETFSPL